MQLQQAVHRFHPFEILYGYRYRRPDLSRRRDSPRSRARSGGIVDPCDRDSLQRARAARARSPIAVDTGALDTSLVRDTRDNPLNPTRGAFISLNLSVAPRARSARTSTTSASSSRPRSTRRSGERMTWSQRYSIGTINTFGDDRLPISDLFRAGGPRSVRGFGTDSLGPQTAAGEALGGGATLILNQELRYQHPHGSRRRRLLRRRQRVRAGQGLRPAPAALGRGRACATRRGSGSSASTWPSRSTARPEDRSLPVLVRLRPGVLERNDVSRAAPAARCDRSGLFTCTFTFGGTFT